MPTHGIGSNPNVPSHKEETTHSYMPNSDIAPLDRIDIQEGVDKSHKKLLQEMQKKQAEKKHYTDTLVSFDAKSQPKIDASPLSNANQALGRFESLNKPTLEAPKQTLEALASNDGAEKGFLDNFFDWFIKPIKEFFTGPAQEEIFIPQLSESIQSRLSEYYAEFAEELEQMKEIYKETDEEVQTAQQRANAQRLRWINCVKAQLKAQEEHMEHLLVFVGDKQEAIQGRQKEHTKVSNHMQEKEARLKPLEWINKGASSAQLSAAGLSAAMLFASFCFPGVAALSAIQAGIGIFGAAATAVEGGSKWVESDVKHELDTLMGSITKWREEDETDTKEIELAMKELEQAFESVQKQWEQLSHIAQMQRRLTATIFRS